MDANNAEHMGYLAGVQTPDSMFHLISSALHYQFNLAWLKAPMPAE
jgi:sulfatase modifying factor 1